MLNLKLTISAFLMYARQLIFGVRDDLLIRERVLAYNFDETGKKRDRRIFSGLLSSSVYDI